MRIATFCSSPYDLMADLPGGQISGGIVASRQNLKAFLASTELEKLEIYLPPEGMSRPSLLAQAAGEILPEWRRGKGSLEFHVYHSIPERWAAGESLLVWCPDVAFLPSVRYIRDSFAQIPAPIFSDTLGLGAHSIYSQLASLANSPWVKGDKILALSTAVSGLLHRTFRDYLNYSSQPEVEVVPQGVVGSKEAPQPHERKVAREKLGLPVDGTLALYRGRLTPAGKADLAPLVEAFAEASGPNDYLMLGGQEWMPGYTAFLTELAKDLGVGSRLIMLGESKNLEHLDSYMAADFFVFPSDTHQESQGMAVAEAMSYGLPVISSDWDGMKDAVEDGKNGYLIPTQLLPGLERLSSFSPINSTGSEYLAVGQCVVLDYECLVDRMKKLFSSPELRQEMGLSAREAYERGFTQEHRRETIFSMARESMEAQKGAHYPKETAAQICHPIPYFELFRDFGTDGLDLKFKVSLTSKGERLRAGQERLPVYDDVLPLVHSASMDWMIQYIGLHPRPVDEVISHCCRSTDISEDIAWFSLALCLKKGMLRQNR